MEDLGKLAGNPMEALHDSLKRLVNGLMDGTVTQFALVAQFESGNVFTSFDNPGDGSLFTLIGAVDVLKDDLLAQARANHQPNEPED